MEPARYTLLLLMFLILPLGGWTDGATEHLRVTFITDPPGANIDVPVRDNSYIGKTGETVTVSLEPGETAVDFLFRLEGYDPFTHHVSARELRQGRVPKEGAGAPRLKPAGGPAGSPRAV